MPKILKQMTSKISSTEDSSLSLSLGRANHSEKHYNLHTKTILLALISLILKILQSLELLMILLLKRPNRKLNNQLFFSMLVIQKQKVSKMRKHIIKISVFIRNLATAIVM